MSLKDQVVLITGCSSGIGFALAQEFQQRGHRVFATARSESALGGLTTEKVALDVTREASIEKAVEQVRERAGRIDILINNAGFNLVGPLVEAPLDGVRRIFETNVTGLLAVTQAVFPHMAEARKGRIVNVGSVVGLLPTPFSGTYCATKSAVHMLSEVLRMECAPFGVDVIVVQPGGVRSKISDTAMQGLERYAQPNSLFRAVYPFIEKRAQASQQKPMPAERFAARVVDGILADSVPRVIREGRGAHIYPSLSGLPVQVRDRVLSKVFGLDTLKDKAR